MSDEDRLEVELDRLEEESRRRERELVALTDRLPAAVSRRRVLVESLRSLLPRRSPRSS